MVRTKDGDGGIKSNLIVSEVQKRPCLFDSNHPNYGDRGEKARCWEEVFKSVVPGWTALIYMDKFAAGKEVQKRWRSIRDSYTKAFRQGKCGALQQSAPGTRRYQYHSQMAFLLQALQNKKPRYSQDKYESFSEVSNSPQHPPPEDQPKIKNEIIEKPLDLKTKPDDKEASRQDKCNQAAIDIDNETQTKSLEIKIDANQILPEDHFDDDKLFMNSLIPLFKKMDDDTRLMCRIEVLKIMRYALQGHKRPHQSPDSPSEEIGAKESVQSASARGTESRLVMTTRSKDGSHRKRKIRSPSPLPAPPKRRGPGRPRKVRPPPSDSDEEMSKRKTARPKMKLPVERMSEMDESLSKATSVAQLSTPLFMKMYNLGPSKDSLMMSQNMHVSVKTEPLDDIIS